LGFRVSVGPPYFNPVSAVFVLPMLLVLLIGPLLRWRRDSFARVQAPVVLAVSVGLTVLVGLAVIAGMALLPLLGMAIAAAVAVASFMPLRGRSLRRLPLPVWGMATAHFGVAVALFGMAADSAFTVERLAAAREGEAVAVGPWQVTLDAVEPVAGANWTALEGRMTARYDGGEAQSLAPQSRMFLDPPQETSETAQLTRWNGQLYAMVGDEGEDGRWQVMIWWKPFVTWIWLGGVLIALGGLLALVGRLIGDLRWRERRTLIAARREGAGR
jgi:cytochrome c-type biogenesis protein CcmF